jgi:hypothetical protein
METLTFRLPLTLDCSEIDAIIERATQEIVNLAVQRLDHRDVATLVRSRLLGMASAEQIACDNLPLPALPAPSPAGKMEPLPFEGPRVSGLADHVLGKLVGILNQVDYEHCAVSYDSCEHWRGYVRGFNAPIAFQRASHPDRLFVVRAHPVFIANNVFRPWRYVAAELLALGLIKPRKAGTPSTRIRIGDRPFYGLDFSTDMLERFGLARDSRPDAE